MKRISKVTNISEIVPWFNKIKYREAPSLHPNEWYQQLLIRKLIQIFFKNPHTENEVLKKVITQIRKKPIIDIRKDKSLSILKPYFNNKSPVFKEGVHPLILQEFIKIQMSLPVEQVAFTIKWLGWNHLNFSLLSDPLLSCIDNPISKLLSKDMIGKDVLSINYNIPLPILIKQFEKHVKNKKKLLKITDKTRYKTPDTYEWHRFGILPYLDLLIWQAETGIKIKNEQLIKAITPYGEKFDVNSLRATKKLSIKLLSDNFLEELATLVFLKKI